MMHQDPFFKYHKDALPGSIICKIDDVYKMVDASEFKGVYGRVVKKYMQLNSNYISITYNISSITKFILCLLM